MTSPSSLLESKFCSQFVDFRHTYSAQLVSWEISCKHGITISMVTSTLLHSLLLSLSVISTCNYKKFCCHGASRQFCQLIIPRISRIVVVVLNYINKIEERNVDRCFLYLATEWMIRKLWFCYCSVVSHALPSPLRSRLITFQAAFTEKVKCTTHECRTSTLQ